MSYCKYWYMTTETNTCLVTIMIHIDKGKLMFGSSTFFNAYSKRCETTSDVSDMQSWRKRLVEKKQTSQYTTWVLPQVCYGIRDVQSVVFCVWSLENQLFVFLSCLTIVLYVLYLFSASITPLVFSKFSGYKTTTHKLPLKKNAMHDNNKLSSR